MRMQEMKEMQKCHSRRFRLNWLNRSKTKTVTNDANAPKTIPLLLALPRAHRPLADTGATHSARIIINAEIPTSPSYGAGFFYASLACYTNTEGTKFTWCTTWSKCKMLLEIVSVSNEFLHLIEFARSTRTCHVRNIRQQQQQTQTISNDSWRQFSSAFSSFVRFSRGSRMYSANLDTASNILKWTQEARHTEMHVCVTTWSNKKL